MATKARTSGQQVEGRGGNGAKTEVASEEGPRSATLNLPFVTAQFRAPDLHLPSRQEVGNVARGARSMLPSGKSMLFYGGLAVTAALGAIEWPVAAAIGVGTAVASRAAGGPSGGTEETSGPTGDGAGDGKNN